jgi:hypothetical protein
MQKLMSENSIAPIFNLGINHSWMVRTVRRHLVEIGRCNPLLGYWWSCIQHDSTSSGILTTCNITTLLTLRRATLKTVSSYRRVTSVTNAVGAKPVRLIIIISSRVHNTILIRHVSWNDLFVVGTLGLTAARTLVVPKQIDSVAGMVPANPVVLNNPFPCGLGAH